MHDDDTVVPDIIDRVKPLTKSENISLSVVDGADHFFLDLFAEDVADADAVSLFDCFVVLPHDASTRVANTAIDVTAMGRPMPSVNP